jgi:hypothetical protein
VQNITWLLDIGVAAACAGAKLHVRDMTHLQENRRGTRALRNRAMLPSSFLQYTPAQHASTSAITALRLHTSYGAPQL